MPRASSSIARALAIAVVATAACARRADHVGARGDGPTEGAPAELAAPASTGSTEPSAASSASAEPVEAGPSTTVCESWTGTLGRGGCYLHWGSCSDGMDRTVRCVPDGAAFACACALGGLRASSFRSADFCVLGTNDPSLDRSLYGQLARDACGWERACR